MIVASLFWTNRLSCFFYRMCVEIFPYVLVEIGAIFSSRRAFARSGGSVSAFGIVSNISITDQSSRILIGWFGVVYIDDWSKTMKTEH